MIHKFTAIVLFLFFIIGCSCNTSSDETSKISGVLKQNSEPLIEAEVSIDMRLQWSTVTDASGYFEISGVTRGEHNLLASKNLEGGGFVELSTIIDANTSLINIGQTSLPMPSVLYSIDTNLVSHYEVPLKWASSIDSDFREYKLYRKDDPGLDETTGELIFVSTDKDDTTFTDISFITGQNLYYRVYSLFSFGRLGGSNQRSSPFLCVKI
jgi:hypothetical protein